jgi:hypothetical protein
MLQKFSQSNQQDRKDHRSPYRKSENPDIGPIGVFLPGRLVGDSGIK